MNKLYTERVIVVEGKYDKIRLSSVVDAVIITTDGFGVFSSKEKQTLIKKLAREKGLLVLTDSDGAGFKIRNFLKNIAPEGTVVNAYIPDVLGKEKRKASPSKEGKLGVEGVGNALVREALLRTGLFGESVKKDASREITTADLFETGFTGRDGSPEKRRNLMLSLGLPARLTGSAFLTMLNTFMTYDEFIGYSEGINEQQN